jgi:hypothetical protein
MYLADKINCLLIIGMSESLPALSVVSVTSKSCQTMTGYDAYWLVLVCVARPSPALSELNHKSFFPVLFGKKCNPKAKIKGHVVNKFHTETDSGPNQGLIIIKITKS